MDKPLGIEEAAEYLGMAVNTLRAKVSKDEIPYHKPSGKIYFFASELNEWIKSNGKQKEE